MKLSRITIAVIAGIIAVSAHAGITVHAKDCTGCTAAQVEALLPNCEQGAIYVTDFDAERLYEGCYDISGVSRRSVPLAGKVATQSLGVTNTTKKYHLVQPDAGAQNTFQAYLNVYKLNGHVKQASAKVYTHVDIQPVHPLGDDGYMNAYDTVRSSSNNDAVTNWLETTLYTSETVEGYGYWNVPSSPALDAAMAGLLNNMKAAFLTLDFNVKIIVIFHDGSERTYSPDKYGDWKEVPGTAKDGHGNSIPDKADANSIANGSGSELYDFSSNGPSYDMNNFLTLMKLYGVPIVNGSSSGGGSSQQLVCSWNTSSNTLTCSLE